jgi:hypothetical protein
LDGIKTQPSGNAAKVVAGADQPVKVAVTPRIARASFILCSLLIG